MPSSDVEPLRNAAEMSGLEVVVVVIGAVVLAATVADLIATVIGVSGGHGVVSALVGRAAWRTALALHRRVGGHHRLLRAAGPVIFVATVLLWAAGLVIGWSLVFTPDSALSAPTPGSGIGPGDRIDHAASLVFGGGTPLAESARQPWGLLSRLARLTGVGWASLGVAYALPVVSSVVSSRRVARIVDSLGGDDGDLRTTAQLDGEDSVVHLHLINLTSDIAQLAEELRAYPIVPYFHSGERSAALAPSIGRLMDLIGDADAPIPESVIAPLRSSIDALLSTIETQFLDDSADVDPASATERRRARIEQWMRGDGW